MYPSQPLRVIDVTEAAPSRWVQRFADLHIRAFLSVQIRRRPGLRPTHGESEKGGPGATGWPELDQAVEIRHAGGTALTEPWQQSQLSDTKRARSKKATRRGELGPADASILNNTPPG